ncbi:protein of unknown function [Candidatus Methylomirabilis oxygeniifera]|uniref:Uncharacterized protein n=1 Tax=Methylomirabilis oxygeniifera TaxID=671143 RepID=D5MKP5_METO1|nr:protein of unknown function [Candidatus Methylomirabilis oxyfera]
MLGQDVHFIARPVAPEIEIGHQSAIVSASVILGIVDSIHGLAIPEMSIVSPDTIQVSLLIENRLEDGRAGRHARKPLDDP